MHAILFKAPGHAARLGFAAALLALLSACASSPERPQQRAKLNTYELRSMKPEMLVHSRCVRSKAIAYAGGTSDIKLIADTAIAQCRGALNQFGERLREFNLTEEARQRYLLAVQIASRNVLTDRLLRARNAARRRAAEPDMGRSL